MDYEIFYAYFSMIGNVRKNHEDNLYVGQSILPADNCGMKGVFSGVFQSSEAPLFGVFDGMGGESCGEVAAFLAADLMRRQDADRIRSRSKSAGILNTKGHGSEERANCEERKPEAKINPGRGVHDEAIAPNEQEDEQLYTDDCVYLSRLSDQMNRELCEYAKKKKIRSMGTTAVFTLFTDSQMHFANIGDSRIYRIEEGRIMQLTIDQVLRSIFYGKPPLLQYLGMDETEANLLPQTGTQPLKDGDCYLLCTDGVTDMLSDQEICQIISDDTDPGERMTRLQQQILQAGARDNATAILCCIRESGKDS